MKNIINFYVAISVPVGIIIWLTLIAEINSELFVILLLSYILVYRTFTDGLRLFQKNVIKKGDIWKTVLMGYHFKYFREIYFA